MVAARPNRRRARGAAFACVVSSALLTTVGACQVLAGIDDRSTGATSMTSDATMATDAASTTASDAAIASDASLTCKLATIADKPASDSTGSVENVTIVAAISAFELPGTPDSAAPPTLGYDLDGVCTCCDGGCAAANGGSCRSATGTQCDLALGVDNSGATLINEYVRLAGSLPETFTLTEPAFNAAIVSGSSTLVFQIKDWNNDDNDTSVELSFFPSYGTVFDDGGANMVPRFDGTDIWTYTPASVLAEIPDGAVPTDYPQFRSTSAYVRDRTLYAQLATLDLTLGDTAAHLTEVKLSADISNAGGVYKFSNGVLTGRWPTANILYRFGVGALNADCSITSSYSALKSLVCEQADLAANAANDGKGADDPATQVPCNAVSVSLGFAATSAVFGGARAGVAVVSSCPTFTDDCN